MLVYFSDSCRYLMTIYLKAFIFGTFPGRLYSTLQTLGSMPQGGARGQSLGHLIFFLGMISILTTGVSSTM